MQSTARASGQLRREPLGPGPQRGHVGGQRLRHRRRRTDQRGFQRGQGELVDPQRAGRGMPPQPLDEFGVAEQQAGLRSAEQLVAARGDEVGAVAQHRRGVGLVGQQRVRGQQPGADVDDQRDVQLRQVRRPGPPR